MKIILIILFSSSFLMNIFSQTASGHVFNDANNNGISDAGENGLAGVCVSNGVEVVQTNHAGEWILHVNDDSPIFLIKPSNYSVPVNDDMIPQYFYLYKSLDSAKLEKKDFTHSGKINEEINFALIHKPEPKKFSSLFFGDPQASSPEEVHYINHDVVEELIDTDAKFGVVLGDIVGHDPNLFSEISQGLAQIGIPWYYIFGNHDSNQDAEDNNSRDETFENYFGPSTYAYEYGQVVFIGLNNVYFDEKGKYKPRFTLDQIKFVKNYLQFVPDNKLVVLMMHIPIFVCENKDLLFDLLVERSHSFSISGHVHEQLNLFLDEKMGWNGKEPHHHLINSTVSGSWWCGLKDETGIPHATMNDGAPNGYSIVNFDENNYSIKFKAARKPDNYQMNIYAPNKIKLNELDSTIILVNIFAGSEKSIVEMQVGRNRAWQTMERVDTLDPECFRMHNLTPILSQKYENIKIEETLGWPMDYPSKSSHIWSAKLNQSLEPGTYTIKIRTTDMYGQSYEANRITYIIE